MSEARICPHCREETFERTCPHDGFQTVDASQYTEADPDALLGTVFEDRYRIEEMIGEGGMGAVFRATQLTVNRQVALKILHPDLASNLTMVARFQQEARAVAALSHPHIIGLIDFGQAANRSLYLVMEFLEGEPLSERMHREGPMSMAYTADIALQILEALMEAHRQGIVHRDLKPENLFLTRRGRKDDFVKVLDFGIAKVSGDLGTNITLTGTGIAIGTPAYIAPEQARASKVTPQSDLYSLGAILYEMLTGSRVFDATNPTDLLLAHVKEEPRPPTLDGEVLEGPLVDFIMGCLAKQAQERPAGAGAAIEWLTAAYGPPTLSTTQPANLEATKRSPSDVATGTQDGVDTSDGQGVSTTGRSWLTGGVIVALLLLGLGVSTLVPDADQEPSVDPVNSATPPATDQAQPPRAAEPTNSFPGDRVEAESPPVAAPVGAQESAPSVSLTSEPVGARVLQGDKELGRTPLEVTWPSGDTPPSLQLELNGQRGSVTLEPQQAGTTVTVPLAPAPARAQKKKKKKKKKKGRRPGKRKRDRATGDDDFQFVP